MPSTSLPHRSLAAAATPLLLVACSQIGPGTIARDRFDYSYAITESWKRQTLLNIVKLRYLDPPIFVDVGQIVAGYTLESGISVAGGISADPVGAAIGGNQASLGGNMRFTDRPTITYVPMTGNKFVRALMTPLRPEALFQTLAGGWAADTMLLAAINTINGLNNQTMTAQGARPADERFLRVLTLLREAQDGGDIGLRVKKDGPEGPASLLVVRRRETAAEVSAKGKELRALLGLDVAGEEFSLAFGAVAQNDKELAVVTRSVLQIMMAMALGVDVPEQDVEEGRAVRGLAADEARGRLLHVRCSDSAPDRPYVTVRYRDRWFWIDDRDLASKRMFAFMLMLFTMSDPPGNENAPVVTIPA